MAQHCRHSHHPLPVVAQRPAALEETTVLPSTSAPRPGPALRTAVMVSLYGGGTCLREQSGKVLLFEEVICQKQKGRKPPCSRPSIRISPRFCRALPVAPHGPPGAERCSLLARHGLKLRMASARTPFRSPAISRMDLDSCSIQELQVLFSGGARSPAIEGIAYSAGRKTHPGRKDAAGVSSRSVRPAYRYHVALPWGEAVPTPGNRPFSIDELKSVVKLYEGP